MMPLSGPYGTEVRVVGTNLGSGARSDVTLTLGSDETRELNPDSTPESVSWTDTEIRFRFPFPLSGAVVVSTPEGTISAGEFEPDWVPGQSLAQAAAVNAVASIAHAPGTISAVLDSGPPKLVVFDGDSPSSTEIATADIRPDTAGAVVPA